MKSLHDLVIFLYGNADFTLFLGLHSHALAGPNLSMLGLLSSMETYPSLRNPGRNKSILRLDKGQYILQKQRFFPGTREDGEEDMLVGSFSVRQGNICRIETDKGDEESVGTASEFPLARLSNTFTELRLMVSSDTVNWKQDDSSKLALRL